MTGLALADLLRRGRRVVALLDSAQESLGGLLRRWRPTPWQGSRPYAAQDDELCEQVSSQHHELDVWLRQIDGLLSEAREHLSDPAREDLANRVGQLRELLRLCRVNDTGQFLSLIHRHPDLAQMIKGLTRKRNLLLDRERAGPAWEKQRRLAGESATRHAYPNTPEWRRMYERGLQEGNALAPLVHAIEPILVAAESELSMLEEECKTKVFEDVEEHCRASHPTLADLITAGTHSVTDVDAVRTRENDALVAMQAPWRAARGRLPFVDRTPSHSDDGDMALAAIWAEREGGGDYLSER